MHLHAEAREGHWISSTIFHFILYDRVSYKLEVLCFFPGWLARAFLNSACLLSALGSLACTAVPIFYLGTRDFNLGPNAGTALLLTGPSS